ncbi:MAG: right-handed parallel beta-helix repeat-containing protein, partial [Bacteroidales bacterium]|nr:right-handed parallel beta-helix repeat-containing protein [Bacteroidales bacterium]
MKSTSTLKRLIPFIAIFLFTTNLFADEVIIGTSTSGTTTAIPANGYYNRGWSAMIFNDYELNGPATITGIEFQKSNTTNTYYLYNQTVYLYNITDSVFNNASYINPSTIGATLVYSGTVAFTSSTGFQGITLQTPFNYTGGHLLLLWENRDGSYSGGYPIWYYTPTTLSNKAKFVYTDGSFPTGNGSLTTYRTNTKFVYTPSINNDLTIEQWVYPTNGTSASSSLPVSVKVKNRGSQAQSNFTLKYSINNGQTWAQQTYGGTLAAGASQNVTFITPASMATGGVYQCIAVVKNTGDSIPANDTLRENITICGGSYSGTYIVGNQSGDHFPDLNSAFAAFNSCGMSGSVVLRIRPGTYNEQIILPNISGLNASKTITIESFTGNKDVVYNFTSTSTTNHLDNFTMKLDGAQFFTIKNLVIKNNAAPVGGHALYLLSAKNNRFENCEFHGESNTASTQNYVATIYFDGTASAPYRQNIFVNNSIKYGSYGIYAYGLSGYSYGMRFIGNTISDYSYYGVYLQYMDSLYFQNNQVYTNSINSSYGVYLGYVSTNLNLTANKIRINYGFGIYLNYCQFGSSDRGKINNNWIYGENSGNTLYGLYLYYCNYTDVEHNSLYFLNPNTSSYSAYPVRYQYGSANTFRNNSVVNETDGYAFYNYNSTFSTFDYNNFYSQGSYLAYYNTNYPTLATLRSGTNTNWNSASSTGVYYSATNLHSNSSSLNGLGSALSPVTVDIDGQPRSSTTPDIGADEFDILANDGGVTDIVGVTNTCAGTSIPLIVSLKNFGTQAITSAYVKMTINGSMMQQGWSGYLSPGGNTNVFLGLRTFSADTVYNFVAWVDSVNHAADLNHYNDTAYLNGYRTSLVGSYTIGSGSSADFPGINEALQSLYQYGVCGPVVFNIESGDYQGNYSITTQPSGMSSVNTVTFRSLSGDTSDVMLYYNAASTSVNYIFDLQGVSNFKFQNITFKVQNVTYGRAISLTNSNRISIDSCLFIGQENSGSYHRLIEVNSGGNISITNNKLIKSAYPIFMYGSSSDYLGGITIRNNQITGYQSHGVYMNLVDTVTIQKNVISCNSSTTVYGIYIYNLNYKLDISQNDIKVISPTSNVYGIYLNNVNYSNYSSAAQINVYNNFIYSNAISTSYTSYGIYSYRNYYAKFYFNTVKSDGGSTSGSAFYAYYNYYQTLLNNNIYAQTGYAFYRYYGSTTSSDYNNFYSTGSYVFRNNSSNYSISTFPSYVSSYGLESHSKTVNPGFIATDDLHIFNQNLNGAATSYGGITVDIDGETRSATTPDIGADEFSLLARDVFPVAVQSPANPAAIGSNPVKVSIKNQGTTGLFSANIFYRLDGGAIDSNYWTGSLNFLEIDSLIDLGTVNLTAGNHTLKVWTKNPNWQTDLNPNNDTLVYSFTAIPKPIIEVVPASITDSILVCNGTSSQSVKIYNRGSANLTIDIDSNHTSGSTIEMLAILTGYYSSSYNNTKSVIQTNMTNVNITEATPYDASTLSTLLAGKDIVLIPRLSSTTSSVLNAYTAFGPVLQSFVNNGGSVIFLGSQSSYANNIWNTGLFTGSYYSYLYSGSLPINNTSHPVFTNLANSYIIPTYYYSIYNITNANAVTLANYSGYSVISERSIGQGKALLFGFDNYYISNDATTMLVNAINYCGKIGKFVDNSSITQTITPGDSLTYNFQFDANGLANGWYEDQLVITHNDQSQSDIEIPCSLYVSGTPELTINKTSHSFGAVYTGATQTDSIYFVNTGCSNLHIVGIASNNSHLVPLKISDTIAPGDSTAFKFSFTPTTTGSYTMTITIFNNDATQTFNFYGTGTPSPAITFNPNPLTTTIVHCEDSVIVPVTISNTGGATLTGNVGASATGDSLEVLMLTYGAYSSYLYYLTNALDDHFTKFNLTSSNITTAAQLNTAIQGKDVVIIPYINGTSYLSVYNLFSTILQNFVSNGGTVIYSGQYNFEYLNAASFFTGSYLGYNSNQYLTVNTTHPVTSGLSSSTYANSYDDFLYYNISNSNKVSLTSYGSYNVTTLVPYGSGNVICLGFYYTATNAPVANRIASQSLEFVYESKTRWLDYSAMNFTLSPGNSTTLNVKFRSQDLTTGQYVSSINFNTNIPNNSQVQLPCTLNVLNELDATNFLGPDTSNCGSKQLNAGSGYSTYQWNTAGTSQYLTATASGYYMVTITDGGNCSSRDTVLLTINPMPNAVISGLPTSACTNGAGIQMTGTPSGGGFIGTGVNGSMFYPANVPTGPYNITYTYTNSYGCTDTDVKTVTVYNPPTVLASGLNASYCPQGNSSTLTGAPSGGVFSGNGISGNMFNPITAGSGNHQIVYTYTDIHGCSSSDTLNTLVNSYTQAQITGYQSDMCLNDSAVTLISTISNTTFSGAGISGSVFNPTTAGVGTHNIFYSYTDANNCSYQDTLNITVHALPSNITLSGLNSDYCFDAAAVQLSGFPLGGSFSGSGVNGTSFTPSLAGVGNHNVTYTYTDVYGCSNTATEIVTVNALPVITFSNILPAYCVDYGTISLSATPVGGVFAGTGVSGTSFNPQTAGVGSHSISYSYTDLNGCSAMDSISVQINPLPTVSYTGLPQTICSNASPVALVGSPAGGVFTGAGASGQSFNPALTSPGIRQIIYTYTDNNGCSNQASNATNVIAVQQVNIGANQTITNNTTTQFNPIVSGGTGSFVYSWSPANKVTNPAILNPTTVPLTQTTEFSLTVTDNNSGCVNSDTALVTVQGGVVSLVINASQTNICSGETVTLQALGSGGNGNYTYSWSSTPAGFSGNTATVLASPSVSTTYSCQISDGSTNATETVVITVKPSPVAQITNLSNSYCTNVGQIVLSATPSGGQFAGSGVSGNIFNPALASIGLNPITYSVTSANGCSDVDTVIVDVKMAPTASAGADTSLPCQNGGVQLGQQPFTGVSYSWYPALGLNNA